MRAPIGLVVLLAVALLVNYVDRGSIAVAAPLLEVELRLSASEMGWVLAAFYWAYAPMQPVMGWCADRFGPARVLAGGFLLWSLATALAGFAGGSSALVALRLLMGVGEATFYPSALSLLSRNVAPTQRARATATMQFGAVLGPAVGTLLGGLIMVRYGWRAMFIVMGLASLLWLLFWRRWMRSPQRRPRPAARAGDDPPVRADPAAARAVGRDDGHFLLELRVLLRLFLASALSRERARPFGGRDGADGHRVLRGGRRERALTGWLLDRWVSRGASMNRAYKTALVLSSAGVGLCLIASSQVSGLAAGAAILLLTGVMDGMNSPSNPSVTQTFAGPARPGAGWASRTQSAMSPA